MQAELATRIQIESVFDSILAVLGKDSAEGTVIERYYSHWNSSTIYIYPRRFDLHVDLF